MIPFYDSHRPDHKPVMLYAIIAVNILVFFFQSIVSSEELRQMVNLYGMVPRRITDRAWAVEAGFPPGGIASAATCIFLHGGVAHLIFNLWSLYIFGDNVEDRMGPFRFFGFYILCGLVASATHVIANPTSTIPTLGASGAIAGVLGAYMFLFPRATITTIIGYRFRVRKVNIQASLYLTIWIVIQIFYSLVAHMNRDVMVGGVAWWAHIGGFVAGAALFKLFLRKHDEDIAERDGDESSV